MISGRHGLALILAALISCAENARDIGAAAPAADQCFSLSAAQAVDQIAGSTVRIGSGGQVFELDLSGDCDAPGGTPFIMAEAGSSAPLCAGQPGGRELIIRHPVTQQSSICHIDAVRRVSPDPAG